MRISALPGEKPSAGGGPVRTGLLALTLLVAVALLPASFAAGATRGRLTLHQLHAKDESDASPGPAPRPAQSVRPPGGLHYSWVIVGLWWSCR